MQQHNQKNSNKILFISKPDGPWSSIYIDPSTYKLASLCFIYVFQFPMAESECFYHFLLVSSLAERKLLWTLGHSRNIFSIFSLKKKKTTEADTVCIRSGTIHNINHVFNAREQKQQNSKSQEWSAEREVKNITIDSVCPRKENWDREEKKYIYR